MSNGNGPSYGIVFHTNLTEVPKFTYRIGQSWFVDGRMAGLGIVEFKPGFIQEAVKALMLLRLSGVMQLPYLTVVRVDSETPNIKGPHLLYGNRLEHSLLAVALAYKLGMRFDFTTTQIRLIMLAALSHDGMTPAGGDPMKSTSPRALDEDERYPELFERNREPWRVFKRSYNLPKNAEVLLIAAIRGEGLYGRIQQIADTNAYLTLDTQALEARLSTLPGALVRDTMAPYLDTLTLTAGEKNACHLWQYVELRGQYPVVTDTLVLLRFLSLRARMLANLYLHPGTAAIRFFMTEIGYPALMLSHQPTPGDLVTWTDRDLHRRLRSLLNMKSVDTTPALFGRMPTRERFQGWDDAVDALDRAGREGYFAYIGSVAEWAPCITKTSAYYVLDNQGRPVTYNHRFPDDSYQLESLLPHYDDWPLHLYKHPLPRAGKVTPGLREAWRAYRAALKKKTNY